MIDTGQTNDEWVVFKRFMSRSCSLQSLQEGVPIRGRNVSIPKYVQVDCERGWIQNPHSSKDSDNEREYSNDILH